MKGVKGVSFGVRFYRRAGMKTGAKDAGRSDVANTIEAIDELEQAMTTQSPSMISDIPEQTISRQPLHPDQELTAPKADIAQHTVNTSAPPAGLKEKALWMAAKEGDCYAIRLLVMDGADLDARDPQGRTAVNIATQYNRKEALKTLLAAKEMRTMAKLGELPQTSFFKKFDKSKTGS
ncbi:MAG: hypothetical protein DI551_02840 [Micavibrio aeruginosavorus]|uniref:Uncharacterized protein n=1 Tax=Micavibrio aeruginosavorus TaxID=349221 RepID=A0A2W5N2V3_9BACT|nr:MAG: hypothetical protein DI551_02840 [Micavibrio aeruginosavorus]